MYMYIYILYIAFHLEGIRSCPLSSYLTYICVCVCVCVCVCICMHIYILYIAFHLEGIRSCPLSSYLTSRVRAEGQAGEQITGLSVLAQVD